LKITGGKNEITGGNYLFTGGKNEITGGNFVFTGGNFIFTGGNFVSHGLIIPYSPASPQLRLRDAALQAMERSAISPANALADRRFLGRHPPLTAHFERNIGNYGKIAQMRRDEGIAPYHLTARKRREAANYGKHLSAGA
jgi:hypothetical protein